MQSIRSRIIIGLIKNRHIFRFQKRENIDHSFSVEEFRKKTEQGVIKINKKISDPNNTGVNIRPETIEGIFSEWIDIPGTPADKVILYIHGGGFISGSCDSHRFHVLKFVKSSGIKALLFNYRLAPEHPFPAAVEDCLTVYNKLIHKGFLPANIIIMGESAGATLTLSTLKALKIHNLAQPAGAVSISPVTDLTCSAESFKTNARYDIAPLGSMEIWTKFYIGKSDPYDPILSPLVSTSGTDLSGLAKTLLIAGTREIHWDDTLNYYKKVTASGSEAEFKPYKNMVHAFPIMAPFFPEANRAVSDISKFIRNRLSLPA